ncbi:unnamed protein product [Lathyrus oleraceus]|uniref:Glutaredoxin domain-containing protein n=1 Tax=Pisum sativum TaxID=3888 RepID=A0A9D4YCF0_PEA|nr:uncharacterized protein At3g28850-like [Pisum sativum]KAI5434041.1 hypothetical protein KIW84_021051 [Pisum sativum]
MWPQWIKSSRHRRDSPPLTRSLSLSRTVDFSCSSFKDIQTILKDKPEPEPNSPKSSSLFRRIRISTSVLRALAASHTAPPPSPKPESSPCLDQRIVVYYTSLRVVRRTFEDCRAVRSILRCFPAAIDERDVSIDDRFRDELHEILGRKNVTLPRVFIGGVYIGGVEEVKRMLDNGKLNRLIERLPKSNQIGCDCCGGFRFIMCDECNGSHKVFTEKSGFRSCSSCNSNGLIRCPACFFVLPRHSR